MKRKILILGTLFATVLPVTTMLSCTKTTYSTKDREIVDAIVDSIGDVENESLSSKTFEEIEDIEVSGALTNTTLRKMGVEGLDIPEDSVATFSYIIQPKSANTNGFVAKYDVSILVSKGDYTRKISFTLNSSNLWIRRHLINITEMSVDQMLEAFDAKVNLFMKENSKEIASDNSKTKMWLKNIDLTNPVYFINDGVKHHFDLTPLKIYVEKMQEIINDNKRDPFSKSSSKFTIQSYAYPEILRAIDTTLGGQFSGELDNFLSLSTHHFDGTTMNAWTPSGKALLDEYIKENAYLQFLNELHKKNWEFISSEFYSTWSENKKYDFSLSVDNGMINIVELSVESGELLDNKEIVDAFGLKNNLMNNSADTTNAQLSNFEAIFATKMFNGQNYINNDENVAKKISTSFFKEELQEKIPEFTDDYFNKVTESTQNVNRKLIGTPGDWVLFTYNDLLWIEKYSNKIEQYIYGLVDTSRAQVLANLDAFLIDFRSQMGSLQYTRPLSVMSLFPEFLEANFVVSGGATHEINKENLPTGWKVAENISAINEGSHWFINKGQAYFYDTSGDLSDIYQIREKTMRNNEKRLENTTNLQGAWQGGNKAQMQAFFAQSPSGDVNEEFVDLILSTGATWFQLPSDLNGVNVKYSIIQGTTMTMTWSVTLTFEKGNERREFKFMVAGK